MSTQYNIILRNAKIKLSNLKTPPKAVRWWHYSPSDSVYSFFLFLLLLVKKKKKTHTHNVTTSAAHRSNTFINMKSCWRSPVIDSASFMTQSIALDQGAVQTRQAVNQMCARWAANISLHPVCCLLWRDAVVLRSMCENKEEKDATEQKHTSIRLQAMCYSRRNGRKDYY